MSILSVSCAFSRRKALFIQTSSVTFSFYKRCDLLTLQVFSFVAHWVYRTTSTSFCSKISRLSLYYIHRLSQSVDSVSVQITTKLTLYYLSEYILVLTLRPRISLRFTTCLICCQKITQLPNVRVLLTLYNYKTIWVLGSHFSLRANTNNLISKTSYTTPP